MEDIRHKKKIGAKETYKCHNCDGRLFERILKGDKHKTCRSCGTKTLIQNKIET